MEIKTTQADFSNCRDIMSRIIFYSANQDKAFIFEPIMTARSSITRNNLRNMISARINDWKVKNIERLTQGVHGKVRSI